MHQTPEPDVNETESVSLLINAECHAKGNAGCDVRCDDRSVMLVRVAGAARRTTRTCSPHPDATLNDHGFAPLSARRFPFPATWPWSDDAP